MRSAVRTSPSAWWASWADCLPMIARRHPVVAAQVVRSMELAPTIPSLLSLGDAARTILDMGGYEVPSWPALVDCVRTPPPDPENNEPGSSRSGWQHEASVRVEQQFREQQLFFVLSKIERALLRSRAGLEQVRFSVSHQPLVRFGSQIFRVLLLRRLRLPRPLSRRFCRRGRLIDEFGHRRATCTRAGVLGRRGFAARVCREGGARVTTNMFVRDLDLNVPNAARDGRRLEVVVDGLPLFGGVQLAIDTTLVFPLHSNGAASWGAGDRDGVVLETARRRKERTYQNSFTAATTGRVWWCWRRRWGAGGLKKRGASSELWPGHVPDLNPGCCASDLNRLGECDGGHCSPVLPHGLSPPLCWSFGALVARMRR